MNYTIRKQPRANRQPIQLRVQCREQQKLPSSPVALSTQAPRLHAGRLQERSDKEHSVSRLVSSEARMGELSNAVINQHHSFPWLEAVEGNVRPAKIR